MPVLYNREIGVSFSFAFGVGFSFSRFAAPFPADGGRAGLLFDRDRRCGLDEVAGDSFSAAALSLKADETDFVRERWSE